MNRVEEVAAVSSSPTNSGASSFQMDIGLYSSNYRGSGGKRSHSPEAEGDEGERQSNSRASDEDDINGINTRKKLRLSKEQSAFLEESFKEHHTLNPVSILTQKNIIHPYSIHTEMLCLYVNLDHTKTISIQIYIYIVFNFIYDITMLAEAKASTGKTA